MVNSALGTLLPLPRQGILDDVSPTRPEPAAAHERAIIELAVTWVFGVQHEAIATATRGRATVALARQVAMYLAHVACGHSLTRVGEIFGRDRTTVAHACMVVEDRRDVASFDRSLDLLELAVTSLLQPRDETVDSQH